MNVPSFIIIGANKGGTTSLYHYLSQHPEVFMSPVKEPSFFSMEGVTLDKARPDHIMAMRSEIVTDEAEYFRLFDAVRNEKAVGEASTGYLPTPSVSTSIHARLPNVKLIAILRNPIERAFSNYLMYLRFGIENDYDFDRVIRKSVPTEYGDNNIYIDLGFYGRQLESYLGCFEKNKLKVFLYDDLKLAPDNLITELFDFIGVDASFSPDMSERHNVASPLYKSKFKHLAISSITKMNTSLSPIIPEGVRWRVNRFLSDANNLNILDPQLTASAAEYLVSCYRDDILLTQSIVGRDLSHWIKCYES